MARRGYGSDVSVDRYADRDDRSYVSRGGGGGSGRRYEERTFEEDVYRSSRGPPVRERETRIREEVVERERPAPPPAFLQEGYGRSTAGPVVLRRREIEDFEFAPRRRSPSPEPERKVEKEEIIIRREEAEPKPLPRREPSREREEIIIRREEKDSRDDVRSRRDGREREEIIIRRDERKDDDVMSRRGGGGGRGDFERDEIIIRTDERERDRSRDFRPPPRENRDREEIIIRRDERKDDDVVSRRGGRGDFEREEIVIRHDERDSDDRLSRSDRDKYALARPISHERSRSHHRRGSDSEQEIIIRRDQRDGGRRGDREKEEIIIRHRSRSNSPSSNTVSGRYPPPGLYPPVGYPPPMMQAPSREDAISRAIDRDYEITLTPRRPVSRPPSPPSPPREREHSAERIAIHRSGERNGREFNEDIVIDRNDTRSRSPLPPPGLRDPYQDYPPRPPPSVSGALVPHRGYDRNAEEEAAYYNDIARQRGHIGEGYNGSTRDWSLVDVPPGTRRIRMDGAGGGEQEITWQRYNGVRRSKFYPDGPNDEGYGGEVGRPLPAQSSGGGLGAAYGRPKDPRDGLWTEITKDLVTKEAIKEMGYEFEETDDFFYVFKYLSYEDMARLKGLSDDIKDSRHRRIKEMDWESRVQPEPLDELPPRLAIEGPRERREHPPWTSDDERYIEREVVYRGGRPPPPPGWRY